MYSRVPQRGGMPGFGLGGPGGAPPRDLLALLAFLFVTFSLQFFASTAIVPAMLRLTPAVWERLWLWQLGTYAFTGAGGAGIWVLLELFFLFLFGRDVHRRLGPAAFWRLLVGAAVIAALAAVTLQLALTPLGLGAPAPFTLMQGQHMLFVVLIAAFSLLFGEATIYLFFVLPVQAKWFIPIELLLAFVGFLSTHDFPGFAGLATAVAVTWAFLATARGRGAGLGDTRKRLERWWLGRRLERMRRKRGLRVVRDPERSGPSGGPWVH